MRDDFDEHPHDHYDRDDREETTGVYREVARLRSQVDDLRGSVDRARGAVWLLVILLGVVGGLLGFVVHK